MFGCVRNNFFKSLSHVVQLLSLYDASFCKKKMFYDVQLFTDVFFSTNGAHYRFIFLIKNLLDTLFTEFSRSQKKAL